MSGSMRYSTIDSSKLVLEHLYEKNPTERYFECKIIVPSPSLDSLEDIELTLYISRLGETGANYLLANGDRVYRTIAQLSPQDEPFDVDIIIRSREASVVGATLSISDEVNRIIAKQ